MPEFVILGASGQLGGAFAASLGAAAAPLTRADADFSDASALELLLRRLQPAAVINCAAHNQVDALESDIGPGLAANFFLPTTLARLAQRHGWKLVHFSTDYVFGAESERRTPYREEDRPAPVNRYGQSKLMGEQAVLTLAPRALVFRVAHLFGECPGSARKSLVTRFIERAQSGRPLLASDQQYLNPTRVGDIVPVVIALLRAGAQGLFHLTGEGQCSVAEFAAEVLRLAGQSARFEDKMDPRPAPRAAYTVLENSRLHALGYPPLPHWQQALRAELRGLESA